MVPGVQVAKIDSNKWAVSARGFNARFSNKLQVMMDGRSAYSPLFSGVFWDRFDTMLEDGSTAQTLGGLAVAGGGTEELIFGEARWGGRSGEDFGYRVFAKGFGRDEGLNGADDWWYARGGFRTDFGRDADTFTLQGEYYEGRVRGMFSVVQYPNPVPQTLPGAEALAGGYFRGRWSHRFDERASLDLDLSYTRSYMSTALVRESRDTLEASLTQRLRLWDAHEVVAGATYRLSMDDIVNGSNVMFTPRTDAVGLASLFVQDEIPLAGEALKLTLGSKFEFNEYTGFEFQPGARVAWKPHEHHAFWASVSRAVRMPSRAENDARLDIGVNPVGPTIIAFMGNPAFRSEELIAYELGYRTRPIENLTFDVAGFVNVYDHLRSVEPGAPFPEANPPPPHFVQPMFASNLLEGTTWGVELAASWKPLPWWTLSGNFTYFRIDLRPKAGSMDPSSTNDEGRTPRHQAYLRSSMDLGAGFELDLVGRFVDALPQIGIPAYFEMDVRLGWRATEHLSLEIVGQNLVNRSHMEFSDFQLGQVATAVERGFYASLTVKF
jgi:iron complex outermembrane receptor protein